MAATISRHRKGGQRSTPPCQQTMNNILGFIPHMSLHIRADKVIMVLRLPPGQHGKIVPSAICDLILGIPMSRRNKL
jgi:hypothetical protein